MEILIKDILTVLPDCVKTCSIHIRDDRIISISDTADGISADKTILGTGKLLMPGLVNAHTHAAMSIFRNSADDLLFNEWLFDKIMPMEDKLTGEDCYWGVMLAVMEMLRTGTTSFIDMYYFTDESARAILESGIRSTFSRGIAGDVAVVEEKLKNAIDEINRLNGHDTLRFMLAPHAPYTCDEGFQREVALEAKRLGIPINTHLSESLAEIDTIKNQYGCSPIELADKTGLLTETTVAAHCVHLSDSDIDLLAERGVNVVTNPVSNLKLANGVAPVPKMLAAGINVALGTDGAASNNTLNMFHDLSLLAIVHKGINHDALAIDARTGFNIATKNGARAMGYSDLGEIKAGNIADLVILNLNTPNMQPLNDPVAALAYSANGSEIETVIVSGKILMETKEFKTIDEDRVYFEINKICDRVGTK